MLRTAADCIFHRFLGGGRGRSGGIAAVASVAFALASTGAEIPLVTSKDLGDNFNKIVRLEGIVSGQFKDETNPNYHFATIKDDFGEVYLSAHISNSPFFSETNDFTGCRVSITGRVTSPLGKDIGTRRFIALEFNLLNPENFKVLETPKAGPFDAPDLSTAQEVPPSRLASLGRRKMKGLVLAVRSHGEMLLLASDGTVTRATAASDSLPSAGDFVEVSGMVETDTYCLNLVRATWRWAESFKIENPPVRKLSAREIMTTAGNGTLVSTALHGMPVRIRAIVRTLPDANFGPPLAFAESDGVTFPIDFSSCPSSVETLERGMTVDATGICWIDIEDWRPTAIFPQAKGFSLVLRTPDDIVVVSRPPWWTPARLAIVIGAMLTVILAVLVWNLALRHAVKRRTRQLFHEQLARISAELKTKERSRLAIELHDSISQTLTGAALKIKAARTLARTDIDKSLANLGIAESTLRSSREELRNCLWDLRNSIFDMPDFEEAVRQMLKPHVGDAGLSVSLPVPRRMIPDSVAHDILKIIRELVVNAIRHGGATKILVRGRLEGNMLDFSVLDNGSGYDERSAPGPEQGHFGLLGIRDRLAHCSGTLSIKNAQGGGTEASVSMRIESRDTEENE